MSYFCEWPEKAETKFTRSPFLEESASSESVAMETSGSCVHTLDNNNRNALIGMQSVSMVSTVGVIIYSIVMDVLPPADPGDDITFVSNILYGVFSLVQLLALSLGIAGAALSNPGMWALNFTQALRFASWWNCL